MATESDQQPPTDDGRRRRGPTINSRRPHTNDGLDRHRPRPTTEDGRTPTTSNDRRRVTTDPRPTDDRRTKNRRRATTDGRRTNDDRPSPSDDDRRPTTSDRDPQRPTSTDGRQPRRPTTDVARVPTTSATAIDEDHGRPTTTVGERRPQEVVFHTPKVFERLYEDGLRRMRRVAESCEARQQEKAAAAESLLRCAAPLGAEPAAPPLPVVYGDASVRPWPRGSAHACCSSYVQQRGLIEFSTCGPDLAALWGLLGTVSLGPLVPPQVDRTRDPLPPTLEDVFGLPKFRSKPRMPNSEGYMEMWLRRDMVDRPTSRFDLPRHMMGDNVRHIRRTSKTTS